MPALPTWHITSLTAPLIVSLENLPWWHGPELQQDIQTEIHHIFASSNLALVSLGKPIALVRDSNMCF